MQNNKSLITKILVPIDGSEHTEKVLNYALDLAEKYSAEIMLFSVAQTYVTTGPTFVTHPVSPLETQGVYISEIETAHKKVLEEAFRRAKKIKPDLNVSKKLVNGRASDEIVTIAKEENFDLIVMGSRGLGGIKEFFLGSVSDRVADNAQCPVLIVK
ncbi:MAG: universal stress protein [Candidatus Bathyarchaeota archaeon]